MRYYLLFILLLYQPAYCQDGTFMDPGFDKTKIDKNIIRVMATLSIDASLALAGVYERQISRTITFVLKAGPSFSRENLSTDTWGEEQYGYTLRGVAAGELRYYFNLNRRIRHKKITRNFSAGYFSIEPFVNTRSFTIINREDTEEKPSGTGAYLNIGFQKQANETTSYGAFFGTRFPGKIYSHSVDFLDIIHAGVSIARVF